MTVSLAPLPVLDTVSIDLTLPLACHDLPAGPALAQRLHATRLALAVLAAPGDSGSDLPSGWQRLEAKVDLSLELLLRQQASGGQPCPCRLGLESLAWQAAAPLAVGSRHLLSLQPATDSALTLWLPVLITACETTGPHTVVQATWQHALGDSAQQQWERWVFRQHRLHVGKPA